jgi:hypothetical protein
MGFILKDVYRGCSECYGSGKSPFVGGDDADGCSACRGTGRELTDLGRELVDWLAEHYELRPRQEKQRT